MSAWPDAVWSAPALRDLDARARAELAAAGGLRALREGGHAFRAGDRAEQLFAVVDGAIALRAADRVVREARVGETFGEEAIVASSAIRTLDAIALGGARVAVLPAPLVRRAIERLGSARGDRITRAARRAVARERLRASALARSMGDDAIDAWLDAATHAQLARGDALFHEGDPARHVYAIVEGMIELRAPGKPRAFVRAGDGIGREAIAPSGGRACTAIAAGPAWVIAIPIELAGAWSRGPDETRAARDRALGDPWRFEVARSLLVIDGDACVRCGHCAWSCASAHADGVARLARVGDVVDVHAFGAGKRALLVAASCQHCAVPACVPACPTGALRREPSGEVSLREALCTGCGACAKACPWDAVAMAPRADGASVAVKCDLCRATDRASPACVDACPTEAIARVDPRRAIAEARAPALSIAPIAPRTPAWPFAALGAAVSLAIARAPLGAWGSGAIAGLALGSLFAYGAWKRIARRAGRAGYVVHLAIAPVACAAIAKHASRVAPNAAGALLVASLIAIATGLALAAAYAFAPPRLARIERRGALPEDLPARAALLESRAFAELTGRSESAKAIFARILRPYARSRIGAIALALRGDARAEEARLHARLGRILGDRAGSIEGLEALVRTAVESRATRAQRALQASLRAPLAPHVIAACVAIALLALHVAIVGAFR